MNSPIVPTGAEPLRAAARATVPPEEPDKSAATAGFTLSIAAVERDSGLSKDTLRVWERRYGFPRPLRDAFGERVYLLDQVDKLRLLKRLMDQGHRPGKIVELSLSQLQQLAESDATASACAAGPSGNQAELQGYIDHVKRHDIDELRRQLSQAAVRMGLARFTIEVVAPLNALVGDAWTRGRFEIFEEHLYTETIQVVLRNAIGAIPRPHGEPQARPRVVLTTFPHESHGLGLLMAEAMFALEDCHCTSLGVQTPVWDIVLAAGARRADIVALSFSAALNPNHVRDGLADLRARLPRQVEIWAGGSCPILQRRPAAGVRTVRRLDEVAAALAHWRAAHPGA